jgi:Cupin superfamily protein
MTSKVSPKDGTMSYHLEQKLLIPNIPVSVLNLNTTTTSELEQSQWVEFLLEEGDMLYLPPRFVHWGLGQSKDCMTLSVGARAPSASDLLIRITEQVQQERQPLSSLQRYKDDTEHLVYLSKERQDNNSSSSSSSSTRHIEPDTPHTSPTLSKSVKESMKSLVRNMMDDVFNDESMWDMIVGKLITDPLRYSDAFPIPYSDHVYKHIHSHESWNKLSPGDIVHSVQQLGDQASLRKVAGISSARSQVRLPSTLPHNPSTDDVEHSNDTVMDRLYTHGEMYEVVSHCNNHPTMASIVFQRIDDSLPVYGTMFRSSTNTGTNPSLLKVLQALIEDGILLPYFEPSLDDNEKISQ